MNRTDLWFCELQMLVARFGSYGFGPDLAELTLADAWGLYRYLSLVAAGG